jgi:hypothetical protein
MIPSEPGTAGVHAAAVPVLRTIEGVSAPICVIVGRAARVDTSVRISRLTEFPHQCGGLPRQKVGRHIGQGGLFILPT